MEFLVEVFVESFFAQRTSVVVVAYSTVAAALQAFRVLQVEVLLALLTAFQVSAVFAIRWTVAALGDPQGRAQVGGIEVLVAGEAANLVPAVAAVGVALFAEVLFHTRDGLEVGGVERGFALVAA